MDQQIKKAIQQDWQIKKFSLYGFLKNIQFFKPYLLVYLLGNNISLLEIGLLIATREIVINIFEIPSGICADFFGRKKMLLLSFIFYIVSFIFFFLVFNFSIAALAMMFFGLAEAFRSGTHKAMIYSYLEAKNWQEHKTFVYGRTRSYSLTGTALSSLLAIVLMLNVTHSRFIFIASIVPYLLDFLLVLSYPSILDKSEHKQELTLSRQLRQSKNTLSKNRPLWQIIFSESFFEALIKSLQDFIQPLLATLILSSGIVFFTNFNKQDNLHIVLGLAYAVISLSAAIVSRRAYLLKNRLGAVVALNSLYVLNALSFFVLSFCTQSPGLVVLLFVFVQLGLNLRKPIFVDEIDRYIQKNERATIISLINQVRAVTLIVMAPMVGYLADTYGLDWMLRITALLALVLLPLIYLRHD